MADGLKFILDTLLLSYSRIFFAENRQLGAFVLAATMTLPGHALFGVAGGALSSLAAWLIGMDRDSIRKGVYGLNGILTGLCIGYFFAPSPAMLAMLALASVLLTLITVFLNSIFYSHCGLPAMSMPFNLASWLVMAASSLFTRTEPAEAHARIVSMPTGLFPSWLESFCSSLGAVMFQLDPLTGMILAAGLLLWSRLALVLLLCGFGTSIFLQLLFGISADSVGGYGLAFNQMFTALAIGGIFMVPGPGSLLMAVLAASVSLLTLTGAKALLPPLLSPLAFPFNLAVWLTLYAIKQRLHPMLDLQPAPVPPGSPEENLHRSRENLRVWKRWGIPISLPFHGKWRVSQGIDGGITHRGDWSFAYDFQVTGQDGATYVNNGAVLGEYHAYGLPVLAPAAGTVHTVIDGIPDNEIGRTNAGDNWGNCVIIEHAPNYYSCLAHLKPSSIQVRPGDVISRGDQLALCGNSGRSPWPHLHFQLQMNPSVGAPSIAFDLAGVIKTEDGHERYVAKGRFAERDVLSNALAYPGYERYFSYLLGSGWPFRYTDGAGEDAEMWESGVDFYGNTYLSSCPKNTRVYFLLADGLLSIKKIEGSRETGLFLFANTIAELPFVGTDEEIAWSSSESADYSLWPWFVGIFDIFALLGFSLRHRIDAVSAFVNEGLRVVTTAIIVLETPFGTIPLQRCADGELLLARDEGVVMVRSGRKTLSLSRELPS